MLFYKYRKKIKFGTLIRLDQTKDRYSLLVPARKRLNNCSELNYVYANISCRLKVKLDDESHKFFESMEKLNGILSNVSD